jgi:hypothetical protein
MGNMKAAASGGQVAPSKATTKGFRKGTKSSKKGKKQHPRCVTVAARDDDGDEEPNDSDEGYVMAADRDFKCQTRPPKDHFKKLLDVTCPNHSYPIKHKLRDCTMMRIFMTSWAFSKGRKPGVGGIRVGRAQHPFPGRRSS